MIKTDIRTCFTCGKTFARSNGNYHTKYCSDKCRSEIAYNKIKAKIADALITGRIYGGTLQEHIFKRYKKQAERHKREFTLTINHFNQHWQAKCYYCNSKLKEVGFDRIDSSKGYTPENVLPCCTLCNLMKRHMKPDEFIAHCKTISAHHFPL